MSNALAESFVTLLDWTLRWWIAGRDPGLGLIRDTLAELQPVTGWAAAVSLALALVTAAVVLMVRRQGADLANLVLGLGRFLLVLSAGWLTFAAGWALSEALGRWIVGSRTGVSEYLGSVNDALADAEPALAMTLSVLGAAAVLGFTAVVLSRFVVAILLAAGIPVIAAATLFRGSMGLRTALAWMVAVLAFRPLTSIVYRIGHDLVTTSGEPVIVLLAVAMTFLLSAAMLPAVAHFAVGGRGS